MSRILSRENRCYFGSLSPAKEGFRDVVVDDVFERSEAFRTPFRSMRGIVRRPNVLELTNITESVIPG